VVPAGVLAEGWRGGPQVILSRFLKGCHVEDVSEAQARATGTLAARSGHDDIVDVSVVEGAVPVVRATGTERSPRVISGRQPNLPM
jgi:hypothetical protein